MIFLSSNPENQMEALGARVSKRLKKNLESLSLSVTEPLLDRDVVKALIFTDGAPVLVSHVISAALTTGQGHAVTARFFISPAYAQGVVAGITYEADLLCGLALLDEVSFVKELKRFEYLHHPDPYDIDTTALERLNGNRRLKKLSRRVIRERADYGPVSVVSSDVGIYLKEEKGGLRVTLETMPRMVELGIKDFVLLLDQVQDSLG